MKKLSLTAQIGIALVLAVIAGMLLRNQADFVNTYIKPIGIIFLNLLKFIVVPLVLFSIMAGILSMNDISKVGKLGLRALLYFMTTTLFAVTLGLVVPSLLRGFLPLIHISTETATEAVETPHLSVMDQIVNMFPNNILEPVSSMAMMQIIVIALFFGIAMVHVGEKGEMARKITLSFNEVVCKILEYIIAMELTGVRILLGNIPTNWSITDVCATSRSSTGIAVSIWMSGRMPFKRVGTTSPRVTAKIVVAMK